MLKGNIKLIFIKDGVVQRLHTPLLTKKEDEAVIAVDIDTIVNVHDIYRDGVFSQNPELDAIKSLAKKKKEISNSILSANDISSAVKALDDAKLSLGVEPVPPLEEVVQPREEVVVMSADTLSVEQKKPWYKIWGKNGNKDTKLS